VSCTVLKGREPTESRGEYTEDRGEGIKPINFLRESPRIQLLKKHYLWGNITRAEDLMSLVLADSPKRAVEMELNEITKVIIGGAIKVHRELGPGLLESAYQSCLNYELSKTGLNVQQQLSCPLIYHDLSMETGYRLDLLVENKVVVEIKSVETLNDVHAAQILTYMKLTKTPIGLLINFNVLRLVDGLKRFIARK
jgi:GxxExxY protein